MKALNLVYCTVFATGGDERRGGVCVGVIYSFIN